MADPHHDLFGVDALIGEIVQANWPRRLAFVDVHQVIFVKVNLLKSDRLGSTNLLRRLRVLLVVLGKAVVKEEAVDEVYAF